MIRRLKTKPYRRGFLVKFLITKLKHKTLQVGRPFTVASGPFHLKQVSAGINQAIVTPSFDL